MTTQPNPIVEALEFIQREAGPHSSGAASEVLDFVRQQAEQVERLRELVQKYEHHHAIIATLGKEHDRPWDGTRDAELDCDCDICQQARKELDDDDTA